MINHYLHLPSSTLCTKVARPTVLDEMHCEYMAPAAEASEAEQRTGATNARTVP